MPRRNTLQLQEALEDLADAFEKMDRRAERMETILMVREPGSTAAADAYDGLRKQVVSAITERLAHLSQLVQFDAAIRNGAGADVLGKMVAGWCESAGLMIVNSADSAPADVDILFELVEDRGGPLEVIEPAYVDTASSRIIRHGRSIRRSPVAPAVPPAAGPPAEALSGQPEATATSGAMDTAEPPMTGAPE